MLTFSDHLERVAFRGAGFDRIRLIAALVVVLHHSSFYSVENIANDALNTASGGAINFGRLAVNVFFVTSGILVAPGLFRSGDLTTFAVNRALRIMPALLVVVIATAFLFGPVVTTLTAGQYFSDPQTYLYLKNAAFRTARYLPGVEDIGGAPIVVNGALWTIYFEILSYVALAFLFLSGIAKRPKLLVAFFVTAYLAYLYSVYFASNPLAVPDTIVVFCQLFVYFIAGVCIFAFSKRIPYSGKIALLALVAIAVSFPLSIVYFVFPIAVSYLIAFLGYSNFMGSGKLGMDLSYGIYLLHSLVIVFLMLLVPQVDNFFIAVPIVLGITILLACLLWRFIEEPCLSRKKLASRAAHRVLGIFRSGQPKPDSVQPNR